MTLRTVRNLGLYLVRPEGEDHARCIEPLLYGWGEAGRFCAMQLKTVFWLGMSVFVSVGLSQLR
ncbi:hypothetical protein [Paucidesulfovibrio longus]|uniref:hypothetical protein n=1 Tax=Paucidesulfovibrio longus TaxID=889 RepID=UPI0003B5BDC0|nr:hypothetical protein [Paucidesulfovibrio longus]